MTNEELKKILSEIDISNIDVEIWKPILYPGLKYHYQISNYGRIRNKTTNKILKPLYCMDFDREGHEIVGYYRAPLHLENKHKTLKPAIHRLVASNFVFNPDPNKLVEVDHIDGNRFNNHYTNLEWVTQAENLERSFNMKLRKPRIGSDNGSSKWTEEEVEFVCFNISKGLNYKEIFEEYCKVFSDTSKSISQIKNLYYNITSKINPKWVHISSKYNI